MPQVTVDMTVDDIKRLIFQLPAEDFLSLANAMGERAETLSMMQVAETGFREWNEEGEDIYDAES